jgi:hypothetical protein
MLGEKMMAGRSAQYEIKRIPPSSIVRLAFNVFPNGDSFLHKVCKMEVKEANEANLH